MSLLLFGKNDDVCCERARDFVALHFPGARFALGRRGEPFPRSFDDWNGDYLVSYLSPWIITDRLLKQARIAAFNFHPGPPEYPGIGCTNFAIYNRESVYGVTCHHMAASVDTGPIIAVERFPVLPRDTVHSLTQRCYAYMLSLFYELVSGILAGRPLPTSEESWRRRPYTRAELDALCRITPDMPSVEVQRRVRAVTFPGAPGAFVEIDGLRFEYVAPSDQSNV